MSARWLLVLVVAAVLLPLGVRDVYAQTNLVLNPGFESGLTSWSSTQSGVANAYSCSSFPGRCRSGNGFANNGSTSEERISQSVTLDAGTYDFTGYYKAIGSGPYRARFFVKAGGVELASSALVTSFADTTTWHSFSVSFSVGSSTSVLFELVGLYMDYDDTSVVLSAPAPTPTAAASPTPTVAPSATPVPPTPTPVQPTGSDVGKICYEAAAALKALLQAGTVNYCWGSDEPGVYQPGLIEARCPTGEGLDCSGSFIWAYNEAGAGWPDANAQMLYDTLASVPCTLADLSCWQVGDATFLGHGSDPDDVYHISMYVGGGLWADCYNTGTGCRVWDVRGLASYQSEFVGVGRPSLSSQWEPCNGTTEIVDAPDAGGGFLNPMGWIWNQFKGLLVPDGDDWQEITNALAPFWEREPMGTIHDVSVFLADMKADLDDPGGLTTLEVPSGPVGEWSSLISSEFSISAIMFSGGVTLNLIADELPGAALTMLRLISTGTIMFALYFYVRNRIQLAT